MQEMTYEPPVKQGQEPVAEEVVVETEQAAEENAVAPVPKKGKK